MKKTRNKVKANGKKISDEKKENETKELKESAATCNSDDLGNSAIATDCDVKDGEGTPQEAQAPPQTNPPLLYSTVMREKIQSLPLPPTLKAFLNYYRHF